MRTRLLAWGLLALAAPARAANLDVSASYRLRAVSYLNLGLNLDNRNNHSFMANDGRLGVAVRRILLESPAGGEEMSMDVGVQFHAVGVAGSSAALATPLDRVANFYPNSDFTPFLENAYLRVHNLFGKPVEATFGRQTYRLGSGLVLDDDGAGLTGVRLKGELPWWGLRLEGFVFNDRNSFYSGPNSLDLAGVVLDLPTEGTWQAAHLMERDRALQPVYGCSVPDPASANNRLPCLVSKAVRHFSGVRYTLNYGPMVFDGEAWIQRGAATPTGPAPAGNHITYNGDAQVARLKWKQRLYKTGEGIARVTVARGSGDKPDTGTRDEAFFPSHGHRYSGLERAGFGEFFAATPYDAYGGNYSTSSASGLRDGASGILVVGAGYTPPAYKGVALDVDFFLFQAERVRQGSSTLGTEWDLRLRYNIRDAFSLSATAAIFRAGTASNPTRGGSRKYALEAQGRF